MLDEGVQIMRQLWSEGKANLDGQHYQIDGAICRPLPIQDGGPPLWIAGGGERKTLRTAAQYAAYTNFDGTPDTFVHKSEVLEGHCKDLGRDFAEITRSANYNVVIGSTEAEVTERLDWIQEHYRKVLPGQAERQRLAFASGPLVGTPEQIVDALRSAEQMGMTYAICYFVEAAYDTSGIELFEREVVPALAESAG